jgi:hypothetical protein
MNSHLRVEWTQLLFIFLSSWSNFFEGSTIILRPREFPERSRTFFQANLCAPPRRTCICRISCFCFRRCRGPGGHQLAHLYIRDYDVFEASPWETLRPDGQVGNVQFVNFPAVKIVAQVFKRCVLINMIGFSGSFWRTPFLNK